MLRRVILAFLLLPSVIALGENVPPAAEIIEVEAFSGCILNDGETDRDGVTFKLEHQDGEYTEKMNSCGLRGKIKIPKGYQLSEPLIVSAEYNSYFYESGTELFFGLRARLNQDKKRDRKSLSYTSESSELMVLSPSIDLEFTTIGSCEEEIAAKLVLIADRTLNNKGVEGSLAAVVKSLRIYPMTLTKIDCQENNKK